MTDYSDQEWADSLRARGREFFAQCVEERAGQAERIAALEVELADTKRQLELTEGSYNSDMRNAIAEHDKLQAENTALRTVVAAWAKENNVGSMTLRDALDAVDILNIARRVAAEAGVQFDQNGVPT